MCRALTPHLVLHGLLLWITDYSPEETHNTLRKSRSMNILWQSCEWSARLHSFHSQNLQVDPTWTEVTKMQTENAIRTSPLETWLLLLSINHFFFLTLVFSCSHFSRIKWEPRPPPSPLLSRWHAYDHKVSHTLRRALDMHTHEIHDEMCVCDERRTQIYTHRQRIKYTCTYGTTHQSRSHMGPKAGGSLKRSNFLMSSRLWISGDRPKKCIKQNI